MPESASVPVVVLDTQVWLDWLVFDDPGVAGLRAAHEAGRTDIVIDAACEAELARVLGYALGRFTLDAAAQDERLERCRAIARPVASPGKEAKAKLPRCRDADDQKFLELALAAGAEALVTKDAELLRLARRAPFAIVRPEAVRIDRE